MNTTQDGPLYHQLSTMRTPPTGWQLVFAQTRTDETGIMTLPLTGYGMSETASVLETHREAALAVAEQLAAGEPAYWAGLEATGALVAAALA